METPNIRSAENQPTTDTARKVKSGIAFPYYDLADSVAVAKAIHDKGGGSATREQVAAFLEYKSVQNGAFLTRIGAARTFGLIADMNKELRVTPLGYKIISPESQEQYAEGLVEAFLTVPLFKAIYDEYRGRDLPEGLGLKNALRLKFKIVPKRIDPVYRVFFESAEVAGFFKTRGSKTQLIAPVIRSGAKPQVDADKKDAPEVKRSGGNGDEPPKPPLVNKDDLPTEYVASLIQLLRDKGARGEVDTDLMERIERLLGLKGRSPDAL